MTSVVQNFYCMNSGKRLCKMTDHNHHVKFYTEAIYINVPFCRTECSYCHYRANLSFGKIFVPEWYIDLLLCEIGNRQATIRNRKLQSLNFGGGTPSLLSDSQLNRIFSKFEELNVKFLETSMELHPCYINFDYFNSKKFTRYSLGIQSLDSGQLKSYRRAYVPSVALNVLDTLKRRADIKINVDFLFQEQFDVTQLQQVLAREPDSITIYPDTFGRGLTRLCHVYDALDELAAYFARVPQYEEFGHSRFIFLKKDTTPCRYMRIQNEFKGNILGIGHNAISDCDDSSYLTLYTHKDEEILYKQRFTNGRLRNTLVDALPVGVTLRMVQMTMPDLLERNLLYTFERQHVGEKHVHLKPDILLFVPEYNYHETYNFITENYSQELGRRFLQAIAFADRNITAEEFFGWFENRMDLRTAESIRLFAAKNNLKGLPVKLQKKKLPNKNILIEGIDGSGKDTFACFLIDELKKRFKLSADAAVSLMGQPMSRFPFGEAAKRFLECREYKYGQAYVETGLAENRRHCENFMQKNQGINICIRGLLTDLATISAVFGNNISMTLGGGIRYDFLFIVTTDVKTALERISARGKKRQWREEDAWLYFFQNYYLSYKQKGFFPNIQVVRNDDLLYLRLCASEIANKLYVAL